MRKVLIILLSLSPLFLKGQSSGCGDPSAINYYCFILNNCDFVLDEITGIPIMGANGPITALPDDFTDDGSCFFNPGCMDEDYVEYNSSHDADMNCFNDNGESISCCVDFNGNPVACCFDADDNLS